MISNIQRLLGKFVTGAGVLSAALSVSALTLDFDKPDPSLPFCIDYNGEWNVIPVTITPSTSDPAMNVTPGDPSDPLMRIIPVSDIQEGVNYEIWPGEPVALPGNSSTPVKGRFYLRLRTPPAPAGETVTFSTVTGGGPRTTMEMIMADGVKDRHWLYHFDCKILTGSTEPVTMWFASCRSLVEGVPPAQAAASVTLRNNTPTMGTIPTVITDVHPYGSNAAMSAAPAIVRDEDNPAPLYGNSYYPIPVTPNPLAQNGDFLEAEITAFKVGETEIILLEQILSYAYYVDRILAFSRNRMDVREGSPISVPFNMTSGFPTQTGIQFIQQSGVRA